MEYVRVNALQTQSFERFVQLNFFKWFANLSEVQQQRSPIKSLLNPVNLGIDYSSWNYSKRHIFSAPLLFFKSAFTLIAFCFLETLIYPHGINHNGLAGSTCLHRSLSVRGTLLTSKTGNLYLAAGQGSVKVMAEKNHHDLQSMQAWVAEDLMQGTLSRLAVTYSSCLTLLNSL